MSASNNNYAHSAFPDDSEFLDAEPLHLSTGSMGLEGFLFTDDEDGEGAFADSRGSADLDHLLTASRASSTGMDFEFETLKDSLTNLRFDSIQDTAGDIAALSRSSNMSLDGSTHSTRNASSMPSQTQQQSHRRSLRRNSRGDRPLSRSFQMRPVNFDPASSQAQEPQVQGQQQQRPQRPFGRAPRCASQPDLSTVSQSQQSEAETPQQSNRQQLTALRLLIEEDSFSESQYQDALNKLAESMKRTNDTRRQVEAMKRDMLTPEQRAALTTAKEQLQAMNQQVQAQAERAVVPPQQQVAPQVPQARAQVSVPLGTPVRNVARHVVRRTESCPMPQEHNNSHDDAAENCGKPSPSMMAAFFSGSRGTLTNGLEQSRRQLSQYMGQMNDRTL